MGLIILTSVILIGCGGSREAEGTGLSENTAYLNLLDDDEILSVVIDGHHYLLPEPLYQFVDNGWFPNEELQGFGYLDEIYLPPTTFMELYLRKDGMGLNLHVVNNEKEEINLLDTTVVTLRVGGISVTDREFQVVNLEKDRGIIVGGITGNTSRSDTLDRLEELELIDPERRSSHMTGVVLSDESRYEGTLRIHFLAGEGIVTYFTVTLGGIYDLESFTEYFADELLDNLLEDEADFMARAYYFEGTIVGIYEVINPEFDLSAIGFMTTAIVVRDQQGELFAMYLGFEHEDLDYVNLLIDEVFIGDEIRAYYGLVEHDPSRTADMIEYEGELIPYIHARVFVVNGEVIYSRYRR